MSETPELKPCPWCGEKPDVTQRWPGDRGKNLWRVGCHGPDCPMVLYTRNHTRSAAIAAWNSWGEVPDDGA